jgi:hypothetical protein
LASVIIDRTHAAYGSGMEAPSVAISPLGLVLDLMWHKVLTRMHKRSTERSGGARTSLAGAGSWTGGRGSKAVGRERESDRSGSDINGGRRRGMGSTSPWAVLLIGGIHRIYVLWFLPPYNTPQRLYHKKFARRLRWIFHQQATVMA